MPGPSQDYVLLRALKSDSCMVVIRDDATDPWEWSEMTAAAFHIKRLAVLTLIESEGTEAADTTEAHGERDANLNALRAKMRSYLGLAKRKYRNDEAKMRLLKPLTVRNDGIQRTLKLAMDVDKAWEQIDSTYVPETGNTFAAFQTLRTTCKTKYENVSKEGAEESEAGGEVSKAIKEIYRLSVDWYQEAIRRFPAGTPHGDMIREQIPTQSGETPPPVDPPGTPDFTAAWDPDLSKVVFHFSEVEGVTRMQERGDSPDGPFFNDGPISDGDQRGDMAPGTYYYRQQATNSGGSSAWSAPVTVVVP